MRRLIIFVLFVAISGLATDELTAETLRVATVGDRAANGLRLYSDRVGTADTDLLVEDVTGIGTASDLQPLLEQGLIDLAVIPFEAIRLLANSPLLAEFMAANSEEVRRSIDSETGAFERHLMEVEGLRVLDFWHVSSTLLGANSDLASVDALQGLKVASVSLDNEAFLTQIGAAAVRVAAADLPQSLQAGALDASAVPYETANTALGLNRLVRNYVDRIYKPRLYAVVVSVDRWEALSFADQVGLSRSAREIGDELSLALDAEALAFKVRERGQGAQFAVWGAEDYQRILQANIADSRAVGQNDGERLLRVAFAAADMSGLLAENTDAEQEPDDDTRLPSSNVTVHFATNRNFTGGVGGMSFSAKRDAATLSFGTAEVALRDGRRFGDDLEDIARIGEVTRTSDPDTIDAALIEIARSGELVIVLVHGYNNSFADAVRRSATVKADIAGAAHVVAFSWPSDGSLLGYGYDASSVDFAEDDFKQFMGRLTAAVPNNRVKIIAHSMGSRLVIDFLEGIRDSGAAAEDVKFGQVVFAASDVGLDKFSKAVRNARPLAAYAESVTVYSSEFDRALGLSHEIHNDARLGLADAELLFLDLSVISVEASAIDPARWYQAFSFATRHSYVFDKARGVADLRALMAGEPPENRMHLVSETRDGSSYWRLSGANQ